MAVKDWTLHVDYIGACLEVATEDIANLGLRGEVGPNSYLHDGRSFLAPADAMAFLKEYMEQTGISLDRLGEGIGPRAWSDEAPFRRYERWPDDSCAADEFEPEEHYPDGTDDDYRDYPDSHTPGGLDWWQDEDGEYRQG